jgi:hypothetical protein
LRIRICGSPHDSPNPTTGAALYALGKISGHQELFREVGGDHEDEPVAKDDKEVRLVEDEHFYSERDFTIIVNTRKKTVTQRVLSFDELVHLAFNPVPSGPNVLLTITYENGPRRNPEGTLIKGETVKIKDGMIFNVRATDKS